MQGNVSKKLSFFIPKWKACSERLHEQHRWKEEKLSIRPAREREGDVSLEEGVPVDKKAVWAATKRNHMAK